jgi:hypothetical protein
MYRVLIVLTLVALALGCGGGAGEPVGAVSRSEDQPRPVLVVDAPDPLEVPERRELVSDTDWEGKAHNKKVEIVEVLNVINPVAAYITAGFDKYGNRFSETLHEEWEDTQVQLTAALTLYDNCKERVAAGRFDKKLFLDLEEVWQLLVKTGVAGLRAKSMIDAEIGRITG